MEISRNREMASNGKGLLSRLRNTNLYRSSNQHSSRIDGGVWAEGRKDSDGPELEGRGLYAIKFSFLSILQ